MRLTETKVITGAIHKGMNQSQLEVNPSSWRKARENLRERVAIGSDFNSDWMKSGASFIKPIVAK